MIRQLLREIDGAMLPAGAAERDHEIFKSALLMVAHAGIHPRCGMGGKLVRARLLVQIVDNRGVSACQCLEAFFTSRIGDGPAVEHESTAVSRLVFRNAPTMERKAENPHYQLSGFGDVGRGFGRFWIRRQAL